MLPAQGWGLAMAPVIQGDRGPKTLTAWWDAVSVAMHGSPPKAGVQEGFLWEAALSWVVPSVLCGYAGPPSVRCSESKDRESFLGSHKSLAECNPMDSFQDPLNSGTLNSGHKVPLGLPW